MKITRIEIKDWRGISEFSTDVGPGGILVKGSNAKGKTSVLNAISAALAARGVDPSDIRHGADTAEILVSLDGLRVRRRISEGGPSLAVTNKDGDRWSKPQSRLDDLLGTAGIDALEFFLAKAPDRRKMVLEAMALTVTAEQVLEWVGDPKLVEQLGTSGPALEVVERYRKHFYGERTDANRALKEKRRVWDEASSAAPAVAPADDPGAQAELEAAGAAVKEIGGRAESAARLKTAQQGTRDRIASLRKSEAEATEQALPAYTVEHLRNAEQMRFDHLQVVEKLKADLHAAETVFEEMGATIRAMNAEFDRARRCEVNAQGYASQAADLEATIAEAGASVSVTEEERQQADGRLTAARARAEKAVAAAGERAAHARAATAATEAKAAEEVAERLDTIVKRLTDEAPRQLAATGGIEGVGLDGDRLTMDGTDLDSLSGAEQMQFAVRLAKRANAKSKILIVDGLERLDAVRGVEFVKEATAGGWQLFATRVADGELVVEAIEP